MTNDLEKLALRLGKRLCERELTLATAESCTGGWAAQVMTAEPGSSRWFERGFVTYSNLSKCEMLGVREGTLEDHGAVSEQTVREMAEGALRHSNAQVSIAISGIAGPDGGMPGKPVGTVCFGWALTGQETVCRTLHFPGDRAAVRRASVAAGLAGTIKLLEQRQ